MGKKVAIVKKVESGTDPLRDTPVDVVTYVIPGHPGVHKYFIFTPPGEYKVDQSFEVTRNLNLRDRITFRVRRFKSRTVSSRRK